MGGESLSKAQYGLLSFTPLPLNFLSFIGSITLVRLIWKCKCKGSYRRLMLGVAISDMIVEFASSAAAFLVPSDSRWPWAFGNETSCNFLAFVVQLSTSTIYYSTSLSIYFWLVIRCGLPEETIASRIEPYLHLLPTIIGFGTATAGLLSGLYGEIIYGPGCWIDLTDPIEQTSPKIITPSFLMVANPLTVAMSVVALCNISIYLHVRATIMRSARRSLFNTIDANCFRLKAVAVQSFLYVAVLVITTAWTYAIRYMETMNSSSEAGVFPLLMLQAVFIPLNGFSNAFIYVRPRYMRCRRDNPSKSRLWALRQVLLHVESISNGRRSQEYLTEQRPIS